MSNNQKDGGVPSFLGLMVGASPYQDITYIAD